MINKELLLFIQSQLALGTPESVIKDLLATQGGWRLNDIDEAIRSIKNPVPPPQPKPVTPAPAAPVMPAPASQPQSVPPTPAPAPRPVAPAPTLPPNPAPAPMQQPAPAPMGMKQPVMPAQPTRMPGTTLVSQAEELSAPKPAAQPVPAPKPVMPPTPAPVAPMPPARPTPAPQSAPKPINEVIPPQPVRPVQPVATPAPTPIQQPVSPMRPVIETNSNVLPTSMALNDIKPPMPVQPATSMQGAAPEAPLGQSPYQPTRAEEAPHFIGMQGTPGMSGMQLQPKKKSSKKLLITILIVVVVLLGAAFAYGYTTYINPAPQALFKQVPMQLAAAKTGHFKATVTAELDASAVSEMFGSLAGGSEEEATTVPISQNKEAQASLTAEGSFDRTDISNTKSETTLSLNAPIGPTPLKLSFETKFANSNLYVKVPDLGLLADLTGGNSGTFLPGDWVSFNKNDAKEIAEEDFSLNLIPDSLTQDKKNQVAQLFTTSAIVAPTVELAKTTWNGTYVHRYQFSVDQKALGELILKSKSIIDGTQTTETDVQDMNDMLSAFTITDAELWIGVWDHKPYRVLFTLKPAGEMAAFIPVKNLKFDISLDSLDKPVTITPPVSAKSISLLLQDYSNKAKDAAIKAGLSSARVMAEMYYSEKHSYTGLCASSNGVKDIVANLNDKLNPAVVYCADSKQGFAVAVPLASQSGVACVDAASQNTAFTSLAAVPTGTLCK